MSNDERDPLLPESHCRQESSNWTPSGSIIRRSWHAMADMISPFSKNALDQLPKKPTGFQDREVRSDTIAQAGSSSDVRNYQSMEDRLPPGITKPKPIATPIKVESKVWFANERTWVAYTNLGVLLGTLALGLYNASRDPVALYFGFFYALVSIAVVIYGYVVYQRRITMIRKRYPGHMDQIWCPVSIGALLFVAIAINFFIRVKEMRKHSPTHPPPA